MDEVCYISNKIQPPNNLANGQYFYTKKLYIPPSFGKKTGALHRKSFSKFFPGICSLALDGNTNPGYLDVENMLSTHQSLK